MQSVDPGFLASELAPAATWSLLLGAPLLAGGVGTVWLRRRRTAYLWRRAANLAGLSLEVTETGLALGGVYRSRSVRVASRDGQVEILVRAVNRARLIDQIRADGPLPEAPWLTGLARSELSALKTHTHGLGAAWSVRIADRSLVLSAAPSLARRPEQVRFLLDLACDLADGVDSVGGQSVVRYGIA